MEAFKYYGLDWGLMKSNEQENEILAAGFQCVAVHHATEGETV